MDKSFLKSPFFPLDNIPALPGLRRRVLFMVIIVGLWIIFQLASGVAFFIFRSFPMLLLLSMVLLVLQFFAALIMDGRISREEKRAQWRLNREDWRLVNAGFMFFTLGVFVLEYINYGVLKYLGISFEELQDISLSIIDGSNLECFLCCVLALVFAPVAEEFIYRRIFFGNLLPFGTLAAAVGAAVIFSLAHFYLLGVMSLFWGALVLQSCYLKSGKIVVPVLIHFFANLCSLLTMLIVRVIVH